MVDNDFIIDEFNRRKFKPEQESILHVHWPDHMLRSPSSFKIKLRLWRFFRIVKKLHRLRGKLIWTVHNLQPHQMHHSDLVDKSIKKIIKVVDGFIFLSETSRQEFFNLYPSSKNTPTVVIPHIHYKDYYEKTDKEPALKRLIKNPLPIQLLCFGLIRNHKGYGRLFEVAQKIDSCDRIGWIIAGNPGKEGVCDELEQAWENNNIVYKACRHIEDKEIPDLFSTADAIVLPYENILNSGTAILALSLDRRVIAPAIGSLIELQEKVGKDWVYLYEQPLDVKKLESAVVWAESLSIGLSPNLGTMSADIVSKKTCDFYRTVLDKKENYET